MSLTQEIELSRLGHVSRQVILGSHHRAVLAHLLLVRYILLRKPEGLLEQEECRDGVGRKRELGELLSQVSEAILLHGNAGPLCGG